MSRMSREGNGDSTLIAPPVGSFTMLRSTTTSRSMITGDAYGTYTTFGRLCGRRYGGRESTRGCTSPEWWTLGKGRGPIFGKGTDERGWSIDLFVQGPRVDSAVLGPSRRSLRRRSLSRFGAA